MSKFFLLFWNPHNLKESDLAQKLVRIASDKMSTWKVGLDKPGIIIFYCAVKTNKITYLHSESGIIIGKLFKKTNSLRGNFSSECLTPEESNQIIQTKGEYLTENFWGTYVSILKSKYEILVGRDCTGMQLCYKMWHDGVFIAFSHLNSLPFWEIIKKDINWNYLASAINYGNSFLLETGLSNIQQVAAGQYLSVNSITKEENQIRSWRPELYINNPIDEANAAKEQLFKATLFSTQTQSQNYKRILLLLSGGLDSSILLASLGKSQASQNISAYHVVSADGDLSEEHYAKAMADKYKVHMFVKEAKAEPIQALISKPSPLSPIPILQSISESDETEFPQFLEHEKVDALFSGQGGDQVYFKKPLIAPFLDFADNHSFNYNYLNIVLNTARLTGLSVWELLKKERKRRGNKKNYLKSNDDKRESFSNPFLSEEIIKLANPFNLYEKHPWFSSKNLIPYGKRHQLKQFIFFNHYSVQYNHPFHNVDIITPFISQPLMETVLRIPSYVLMLNGQNRGLARESFRHLLPKTIFSRENKGFVTKYYHKVFMQSLPLIKSFLLEGNLTKAGFLNKRALEEYMNEENLRISLIGSYIHNLISYEKWTRNIL